MVVGALAVSAYGFPRASDDIDIVIHLPFTQRARVAGVVRGLGVETIEEAKDEFGQRLVFEAIPGLKVELFFTPPNVVYDREYARRRTLGLHGEQVPLISPEDLVLRKLVNTRL